MRTRMIGLTAGLLLSGAAVAGEVSIERAEFRSVGPGVWYVDVTLKHADTGWDHYADEWRVVDADGNVLADRVLWHPHVNEQPFTRGMGGINIPIPVTTVFIEAHDKVHGWSKQRLEADLQGAGPGFLKVVTRE